METIQLQLKFAKVCKIGIHFLFSLFKHDRINSVYCM